LRKWPLLRSNTYLLDELASLLLEREKVGGEELMKLVNKAAITGKLVRGEQKMAAASKLVMGEQKMAAASFSGEKPSSS
jgi:hypothetical protein